MEQMHSRAVSGTIPIAEQIREILSISTRGSVLEFVGHRQSARDRPRPRSSESAFGDTDRIAGLDSRSAGQADGAFGRIAFAADQRIALVGAVGEAAGLGHERIDAPTI